ncbi:MAG: 4-hydroxy-tetrahydrodipicolinate reductase [Rubrivivax sp.]
MPAERVAPPALNTAMLKIAVAGASGRMGRMLIQTVLASPDCRLSGALDAPGSRALGADAGAALGATAGVAVTADLDTGLAGADVLIDFTQPEATMAHLAVCRRLGVRTVIGTTGFDAAQKATIAAHAATLATVLAPNMSVGINVMLGLLTQAAAALGDGYDIEVFEAHHRDKVDAPSGTALAIGDALAAARGIDLEAAAVWTRQGHTGARRAGSIGFSTLRGGDIVGEHSVWFAGAGERIEITHKSSSRANYAEGSLRAARFLAGRAPGLYGMDDVLGLRQPHMPAPQ